MTSIVDASVVVAALVDNGPDGNWARSQLRVGSLFAPQHMPVEAANVLRRSALSGNISHDAATLGHQSLLELRVQLFGYRGFGSRVWELRHNLTTYDAWYVALAEHLRAPLVTLDHRLATAPGTRCTFRVPPPENTLITGME